MVRIYDLIYDGRAKEDIKTMFPQAKIEDEYLYDDIHETRFSVEIDDVEYVDYLVKIIQAGMINISLLAGVKLRIDSALADEVAKRLKTIAPLEESEPNVD